MATIDVYIISFNGNLEYYTKIDNVDFSTETAHQPLDLYINNAVNICSNHIPDGQIRLRIDETLDNYEEILDVISKIFKETL